MSVYEKTSVKLDGCGDTHAHGNPDKSITVTTQFPGGVSIHDRFDSDLNHQGATVKTGN
jgi:hypothetical protein